MFRDVLMQVLPNILYLIVTFILGLATYYVKIFLNAKNGLIEKQKEEITQKIGIDKYNQDVAIAKNIVMSVEQLGWEYNWEGETKHSKAIEIISQKTGLSNEDIFNIIKSTVAELNTNKDKNKN